MKRNRGFTLFEMLVSVIVLAIMASIAAPMMATAVTAYERFNEDLASLDRVRYATERLARELREVAFDGSSYNFASMSTSAPVFTKNDGITVTLTNTAPTVTLAYSTPAVSPTPILSNQVQSLSFAYFDETGTATATTTTAVRYVEVALTLIVGTQTFSERTRVQLRNNG
jgi:MSHA biogenesis protein MshO